VREVPEAVHDKMQHERPYAAAQPREEVRLRILPEGASGQEVLSALPADRACPAGSWRANAEEAEGLQATVPRAQVQAIGNAQCFRHQCSH
jgi:hypothetical protein